MSGSDQHHPWTPLPNMRGEFSLVSLEDGDDGLRLVVENDTGRALTVEFRSALTYRLTGRLVAPKWWAGDEILGGGKGSFFRCEPSSWLAELGNNVKAELPLMHFTLVFEGEVIDVVTDEEPTAAWTNSLFGDAV